MLLFDGLLQHRTHHLILGYGTLAFFLPSFYVAESDGLFDTLKGGTRKASAASDHCVW
jgi:hypothetical protein